VCVCVCVVWGVVWCALVRCGVGCFGSVWCGRCGAVWCGVVCTVSVAARLLCSPLCGSFEERSKMYEQSNLQVIGVVDNDVVADLAESGVICWRFGFL